MSLRKLMHEVLPFRSDVYIGKLCWKLLDQGVEHPEELLRLSTNALEMKLISQVSFTIGEVSDCVLLRSAADTSARALDASGRVCGKRLQTCFVGACSDERPKKLPRRNFPPLHDVSATAVKQVLPSSMESKPRLWQAVEDGDDARVAQLLLSGLDPEERFQGWTPLMKAAEENRADISRMLLEKSVNINAVNKKGRSALSFAAAPSDRDSQRRESACDVLRLLLERGADSSLLDAKRCTARIRAMAENRDDAVDIFKEFGL